MNRLLVDHSFRFFLNIGRSCTSAHLVMSQPWPRQNLINIRKRLLRRETEKEVTRKTMTAAMARTREEATWIVRERSQPGKSVYYHRPTGRMFREPPAGVMADGAWFTSKNFLPYAPLRAYFDFTYRCNLECKHCITNSSPRMDVTTELSTDRIKQLLTELGTIGVLEVQTSGGEPFMHRDWKDIFAHIVAKGMNLIITTNGLILRPAVLGALTGIRPLEVRVSFDGGRVLHEHIRGARSYGRALDGLRQLRQHDLTTTARLTLCRGAEDGLPELFKDVAGTGTTRIKVALVKSVGRAATSTGSDLLRRSPDVETVDWLRKLGAAHDVEVQLSADDFPVEFEKASDPKLRDVERPNCGAGFETAYISPRGDLLSCVAIPDKGFGTLHSTSFIEAWTGRFADRFRKLAGATGGRRLCDSLCAHTDASQQVPVIPMSALRSRIRSTP